jgi:hypothetical protein
VTIRDRVEDAAILIARGRHDGALLSLLAAVAGSSRKALPKGSQSLSNPKDFMRDGEAFRMFLGGRIQRLLYSDVHSPEFNEGYDTFVFDGVPCPAWCTAFTVPPWCTKAGLALTLFLLTDQRLVLQ